MSAMRILLVSEWFPPEVKGGGERSAELIAKNLISAGHEVHVLTTGTDKPYELRGATLHRILSTGSHLSIAGNIKRMLSFPRQVRAEVALLHAKHTFHIIHYLNAVSVLGSFKGARQAATINSFVTLCPKGNRFYKDEEPCYGCNPIRYFWCILNSRLLGIGKNPWWFRFNPLLLFLPYLNYLRFQKALRNVIPIAASNSIADQLRNLGFEEVAVVPHFPSQTEPPRTKQSPKNERKNGKLQLLYVGQIERQKGTDMLIRAYASIPEEIRTLTELTIAGDGSLRRELEENSPKEVQFLGHVRHSEAINLMKSCDLVVAPSAVPEPLSRVILEAVSLGTPVLAVSIGGNTDIIQEGVGGFLIPQSIEALKVRLTELIQNPQELKVAGQRGKERFKGKFSAKIVLKQLESLYSSDMGGKY